MLILNEKETEKILNIMEFLETLETPEATKNAEIIDDITYAQTQQDADIIDLLLGCFNELDEINQEELIYNQLENLLYTKTEKARKETLNDDGYYNIKLKTLIKEIEKIENFIENFY